MHAFKLIAAAALSLAAGCATATTITISGGGTVSSGADCTFACVAHYQQVYDNALFGSAPVNISSFSFITAYASPFAANNLWEVRLQTMGSTSAVNALQSSFATNLGSGSVVYEEKSFSGNFNNGSLITFEGSYVYNPTLGDLLIDIVAKGSTGGPGVKYNGNAQGQFSRDYNFSAATTGYANTNYGNVTQFTLTAPNAVPEPGSLALLGVGLLGAAALRRRQPR